MRADGRHRCCRIWKAARRRARSPQSATRFWGEFADGLFTPASRPGTAALKLQLHTSVPYLSRSYFSPENSPFQSPAIQKLAFQASGNVDIMASTFQ